VGKVNLDCKIYNMLKKLNYLSLDRDAPSRRLLSTGHLGRAIAQAVSRRLPTAAALVRAQARLYGTFGRESDFEADFLRVLRFLLSILIPPTGHTRRF
jgi:hypothetical protein